MRNRITAVSLLVTFVLSFSQPLSAAEKWQEGTASITANNNQQICPVGTSTTARAPGCAHSDCTAAKQQAAANLREQYPDCGAYIRGKGTCLNGPSCRK